jgi:peroxiredoxin
VGGRAPNLVLRNHTGATIRLADFWRNASGGAVLNFLRHFDCHHCRVEAAELVAEAGRFRERGLMVVLIGDGPPAEAAALRQELGTDFPVLADPARRAYALYGLAETEMRDLLRPGAVLAGLRAVVRGAPTGLQPIGIATTPAAFVVDRLGTVRLARPAQFPDERATVEELLGAIG